MHVLQKCCGQQLAAKRQHPLLAPCTRTSANIVFRNASVATNALAPRRAQPLIKTYEQTHFDCAAASADCTTQQALHCNAPQDGKWPSNPTAIPDTEYCGKHMQSWTSSSLWAVGTLRAFLYSRHLRCSGQLLPPRGCARSRQGGADYGCLCMGYRVAWHACLHACTVHMQRTTSYLVVNSRSLTAALCVGILQALLHGCTNTLASHAQLQIECVM